MTTQGSRFKEIRTSLKLSQEDFANFFDTSIAYISQIEKDKCRLSINNLIKLSLEYKVNLNYLLCSTGSPFINTQYTNMKSKLLSEFEKILDKEGIA